ncbi:hypothetical protein BDDG_04720 [Blastomyces dermatitidis ATCC 18188]|uniref:Uncharacterized protein n=1 Tax=Ajellomyces dermatitidis (strain ATCC 18188 / CBS 674.68) TaxID=653446 RepID=F2TEZ2_AJEDA|nr:hypothetical protein BDDG_04720 [Blastomyces dermatitidis ATCC 18188]
MDLTDDALWKKGRSLRRVDERSKHNNTCEADPKQRKTNGDEWQGKFAAAVCNPTSTSANQHSADQRLAFMASCCLPQNNFEESFMLEMGYLGLSFDLTAPICSTQYVLEGQLSPTNAISSSSTRNWQLLHPANNGWLIRQSTNIAVSTSLLGQGGLKHVHELVITSSAGGAG